MKKGTSEKISVRAQINSQGAASRMQKACKMSPGCLFAPSWFPLANLMGHPWVAVYSAQLQISLQVPHGLSIMVTICLRQLGKTRTEQLPDVSMQEEEEEPRQYSWDLARQTLDLSQFTIDKSATFHTAYCTLNTVYCTSNIQTIHCTLLT